MALADLWTQAQLNAAVRRELMDPTGTMGWSWSDKEVNRYLEDWQNLLQDRFEFVWGSATHTTSGGTTTFTLTNISPIMLRPGRAWWNGYRIPGRNKEELEMIQRDWRGVQPGVPEIVYQDDINTLSVWPPPATTTTDTLVVEFPQAVTFGTDTTTPMSIPAWTKYSAVNYCAMRAYMRPGPQQDLQKGARYKAKFIKQGIRIRTQWEQYFPDKAPSLRFAGKYEGDILNVGQHNTLFSTWF